MKSFAYVCADPGIPIPGTKGGSIHVASVCQAFGAAGLNGTIHALRPETSALFGFPIRPLGVAARKPRESELQRETRLFLGGLGPGIQFDDDCDFVYERYSLWHVGGLVAARKRGVPFILEVNSPLPDEARRFRGLEQDGLACGIARLLMREADGVVCVSEEVADWVTELRGNDDGVWLVPNGVDPVRFSPETAGRSIEAADGGPPLLAFCGSFRPWHGLDDLLESFRILIQTYSIDARMLCIGDGPLRSEFDETARKAGLADRIRVTGLVPHDEVPRLLRCADVAIAPYPALQRFYFSPLKIFEFMALRIPVVAANVGQLPAILGDGERGLLYGPGRPEELAEALHYLLDHPSTARRIARSAREWVLMHATWARRVDSILDHVARLGGLSRTVEAAN